MASRAAESIDKVESLGPNRSEVATPADSTTPVIRQAAEIAQMRRELRKATLQARAGAYEITLLRDRVWRLQNEIDRVRAEVPKVAERDVPWRVVSIYMRIRPFVPTSLLVWGAKLFDRNDSRS